MTDRGQKICQRMRAEIDRVVPEGIEAWGGAIPFVREPTDQFLDRLEEWEQMDTPETRADLQNAANALLQAWQKAGWQFEAEGHPQDRTEVPA